MAKKSEFVKYLMELLEPLGGVEVKAMFGGFGIYKNGLMLGLVSNDTLYFKVDDKDRPDYEARGLGPFKYKRQGKEYAMSYYQAPHDAMDNAEDLSQWAQKAYEAAVRAVQKKPKKKRNKK